MPADPNWLYSAIAQSSAAIVAIIGGFITSTLLIRGSEMDGLRARIDESEHELDTLIANRDRVRSKQDKIRADFLLEDSFNKILELDPMPAAEEAQMVLGASNIPVKEFGEVWRETVEAIGRERELVTADIQKYGEGDLDFDEWVRENKIDMSGRDKCIAYRVYFDMVLHRVKESAPPKKQYSGPPGLSEMLAKFTATSPSVRQIRAIQTASDTQREIDKQNNRRRQLESCDNEISSLDQQISLSHSELTLLKERLSGFSYPGNLRAGMFVLAFFAVAGILLPFYLMPQDSDNFIPLHKTIAIGGFVAGLLAVFVYIGFLIKGLNPGNQHRRKD